MKPGILKPYRILNSCKVKASLFLLLPCLYSCGKPAGLEYGFQHPRDTMQMSIYWSWISDNISKKGVVKDLEAMKKAGITRTFMSNIALYEKPFGIPWGEIMRRVPAGLMGPVAIHGIAYDPLPLYPEISGERKKLIIRHNNIKS